MKLKQQASAALVSLLVIAVVSLLMVLAFAENSISTLEIQYQSQESSRSYYLAESCLEESISRLESDIDFSSGLLSFDSSRTCSIVVTGTNPKIISIVVTVDDLIERFEGVAAYTSSGVVNNFVLSSWTELP